MDAIETAVRNAFAKGDPSDPGFRERVYRAAFTATEKAIESNPGLTPEAVQLRRDDVRARIEQIESEFAPTAATESSAPAPEPFGPVPVEASVVAAERRASRAQPYVEPRPDPPSARRDDESSVSVDAADIDRRGAARRGGGVLSRMLPIVVLFLIAAGVWWVLSSGIPRQAPQTAEVEAPTGQASPQTADEPLLPRVEDSRDWITIFTPDDPASVVASGEADAEVMQDDSGRFIRIRSGADGSPVSFDVGEGVLERVAGDPAVFNIVARAEEGMPTEIAVECDFGALGDCGRRRYAVNYERGDYLFEVELPDAAPDGAGTVAITSDVDGEGKGVDIYEIRVSAGD